MRVFQTITLLAITCCVLVGCSKSSPETSVKDSLTTVAVADSATVMAGEVKAEDPKEPEIPIVISDSAANALNTLVNSQFEKIYLDTANCYKVVFVDYYDEWEGQAEMRETVWFLNKDFAIVYGIYSYQNGAMEQPDVTEFAVTGNEVIATKEFSLTGYQEKTLTRWDARTGGAILKWSDTFERMESVEPVPADYGKKTQDTWNTNLNSLTSTIESEDLSDDQEIYTILKEVPKPAELTDYTKWIIPKAVYDKFKSQ